MVAVRVSHQVPDTAFTALAAGLIHRIVRVSAIAFKEGARFDSQCLMVDVTFNVARTGKMDPCRSHTADDPASDNNLFTSDFTVDGCLLANCQGTTLDVALNLAIDLNVAGGDQ